MSHLVWHDDKQIVRTEGNSGDELFYIMEVDKTKRWSRIRQITEEDNEDEEEV